MPRKPAEAMAFDTDLFRRVIEADLNRLHLIVCEAELESEVRTERILRDPLLVYAAAIERFWRGERAWLATLIERIDALADEPGAEARAPLRLAVSLRYRILTRELEGDEMALAERLAESDSPWAGELCILVAAAYEVLGDCPVSQHWYHRAVAALGRAGAHRKAVRAMLNVVTNESRINVDRNLIARYHDVYRQAMRREIRELTVAGLCMLNISRDYQKLGATLIALRHCNRAIRLLEHEFGTLPYYLAVAHRCSLFIELDRLPEARLDFECASAAPFDEVKTALRLLEHVFATDRMAKLEIDEATLHSSWRERRRQWLDRGGPETPRKLSKLEQRLISLLSEGPVARHELIERLYGDRLAAHVRMNRFQSLLSTLRKKWPGVVIYESDHYRLADPLFPAAAKAATGEESA